MPAPGNSGENTGENDRLILFLQYCLPISFTFAMTGLIIWIVRLIFLARRLHDVPSASVGISIVAIPVFLILLGVFWYVFLGIVWNREVPAGPGEEGDRRPVEGVDA